MVWGPRWRPSGPEPRSESYKTRQDRNFDSSLSRLLTHRHEHQLVLLLHCLVKRLYKGHGGPACSRQRRGGEARREGSWREGSRRQRGRGRANAPWRRWTRQNSLQRDGRVHFVTHAGADIICCQSRRCIATAAALGKRAFLPLVQAAWESRFPHAPVPSTTMRFLPLPPMAALSKEGRPADGLAPFCCGADPFWHRWAEGWAGAPASGHVHALQQACMQATSSSYDGMRRCYDEPTDLYVCNEDMRSGEASCRRCRRLPRALRLRTWVAGCSGAATARHVNAARRLRAAGATARLREGRWSREAPAPWAVHTTWLAIGTCCGFLSTNGCLGSRHFTKLLASPHARTAGVGPPVAARCTRAV